jgi:hypothetical protein
MKKSIIFTKLLIWSLPGIIKFLWRKIVTGKGREISVRSVKNWVGSLVNEANPEPHIQEQYEMRLRLVSEKSPDCLLNGKCKCGCDMPEKLYEPEPCEYGCYERMLNQSDWNDKKKSDTK